MSSSEKKKIINDPVYGFIHISGALIFHLIEHPFFQRLRHIKQLGLAHYVYPGAQHTRFQHALGSLHLMGKVLDNFKSQGIEISNLEYEATQIAVLLHDIGHGPFSHTLEESLLPGVSHESLSFLFMKELNKQYNGSLDLTLKIFQNTYSRKFFNQLISSQLDIDRLDYLKRDSFFTGVQEGTIGVDRIISMLSIHNDQLVVEEKGIYSIENFLSARRLMYWQVYLHKSSVSAERMLVNLIKRAQYLVRSGEKIKCSDCLKFFLENSITIEDFSENNKLLHQYGQLDDNDLWGAMKMWQNHSDPILSILSKMILQRTLFKIIYSNEPINKSMVENIKVGVSKYYSLLKKDSTFLFSTGTVSNEAYVSEKQKILIYTKGGSLIDIAQASDLPNIKAMSKIVKKNYLCWPKNVSLAGYKNV